MVHVNDGCNLPIKHIVVSSITIRMRFYRDGTNSLCLGIAPPARMAPVLLRLLRTGSRSPLQIGQSKLVSG
jgi:hypothetical protein